MKLVEEKNIETNNTILIIGEVQKIIIDEKFIDEEGSLDYHNLSSVCISGLDTYYETNKISKYPYARKDDLPF